ncbi:putative outer membrane protein probably involved in nutrient binding protein [Lunatimonas lonarensis]|uniref:Putative outer membrane protein probably involved in nutrient binding protein n=1 Tax=Lunatimonas lonarensis TaxID=1232681 RepID=R7ZLF2_9BACT|nr:RagB/SusD family nutrient uptake outer membrane protein [Lunatimonas lonarensis]EON74926.1 putative outer membrane protein probably involved in nutrient binding protein [Lunatimonas lonarensis]
MEIIKNIIWASKAALIAIVLIVCQSCQDFLERNPTTQISSPTFWKNQKDADLALAGVYSRLNVNTFNFEGVYSLDIMAGDANEGAQSLGASSTGSFAQGNMEAVSGGLLANIYNECYRGVASCNFFLANIDRVEMPEATRTIYKAEVQFLRALFYFNLVDFYGGVPLYTRPVTIEEATVQQSTREQVVQQVIADLDFAIANLPNTDYSARGHAVRGSALALKSRVLLFMSDWPGAAAAAKQVMDEGKFSLFNNFKTLFLAEGQNNNPEIMFSTRYLNPDNSSQQDIRLLWHGIWNPRAELRDAFECVDGLPINQSPLYDPTDWKKNRDPRLLETIRAFTDPAIKASGEVVPFAWNGISQTGLSPVKGGNVETLPIDYATRSEQDWVLLRYAEVLLNYAEALNESQGPVQQVYDAINQVRARPGVEMPPLPTGLTQSQMRDRIRNERRVEFAFEGMRYRDIRRWRTAETYINSLVEPGSNIRRVFDPSKHYLFPFPQSEIDINPNLIQNPGY